MRPAFFTDGLGRELHVLFQFKLMNTCDDEVTTSNRDGYTGLATLTTGGTSAIVARKSQMRPLHISACQISRLTRSADNPHVSTSDVPDRKRRVR